MKVLKFGGTSVGTVESLRHVKSIVESCEEPVVVVVSALGGITDKLIATAREAAACSPAYQESYEGIKARHEAVIDGMVPAAEREAVRHAVDGLLDELANIYRGISLIKDLSQHTLDIVVSYGERLSSAIISHIIAGARLYDSREFIRTTQQFGKHILNQPLTDRLVRSAFADFEGPVAIVPGFIGSDHLTGEVTNLGRGGSDYTAAIIAATLDARLLEIWTDVDGFMTADPRVISKAYVIDRLSFVEAMELCNFGAKVVYPPTIYPVFHKNIPILIKNTFNPSAPGTIISDDASDASGRAIKGISSINDTCLVAMTGFLVSQASSEHNISFAVRNADADTAVEVLSEEFAAEIASGEITSIQPERDLATVAIVGENMKHTPGIAGKLFNTLGRNGINVIACAQGASETNISFVIKLESLRKALNVIHDSFFLSPTQMLNVVVAGVGHVGRKLLGLLAEQHATLYERKQLEIRVVGISNSRRAIFDRDGIDLATWQQQLADSQLEATPERIRDEIIAMNQFNSVFVDCTASPAIAGIYADLLDHNVNVVAANKIAASSDYDNYSRLKRVAARRGVKFLFETNVGAGLPIISTINNLINSGDNILEIEAVLSGTLNYIFNTVGPDVSLSTAIAQARDAGYSEPDPRVDLSGTDVVRKLVILARESGYRVEQSDVERKQFIPETCFEGTIDEFIGNVATKLDARFEQRRAEAERAGKRLRYVASLVDGRVSVGVQQVDDRHPFYSLDDSNNVILITTDPMEIKGYGAGAEVTAAGVFADIISIANIR